MNFLNSLWSFLQENWLLILIIGAGSLWWESISESKRRGFLNTPLTKDHIATLLSPIGSIYRFIFTIISDKELERKAWFRFLRVINIVIYALVISAATFVGWLSFDNRKPVQATVLCKDGTRWNTSGEDGWLLNNFELCGLCTKRSKDANTYILCTLDEYHDASGSFEIVDKQYNTGEFIKTPLVFLIVALALLKLFLKAVIYIVAGVK